MKFHEPPESRVEVTLEVQAGEGSEPSLGLLDGAVLVRHFKISAGTKGLPGDRVGINGLWFTGT